MNGLSRILAEDKKTTALVDYKNFLKEKDMKQEMNKKTMKKNDLWSDHPEIQFGPIIFSFETMNPGLYYVPEKSILIKRGYLDWRAFSSRNFFL